jgi:PKD repeat protein
MVELALVLPVVLLFLLIALDFGRVYLGYVNLQNLARIAANFAANSPTANYADTSSGSTGEQYQNIVLNDANATNCDLLPLGSTDTVPTPVFTDQNGDGTSTGLGDLAKVGLTCSFDIWTPIISSILADRIDVSASATFPVKSGGVAGIPTGGGGPGNAPTAAFTGAPVSGSDPLSVFFDDQSFNAPVQYSWNFGDGNTSSTVGDVTHVYNSPGTYTVTLTVTNTAGSDVEQKIDYITVTPGGGGPLDADFAGNPLSGSAPLDVAFSSAASIGAITTYAWDFDGNGTTDSTAPNPTHTYSAAGTYTVSLTVGDGTTTDTETKVDYINVGVPTCTIPNVSDGNKRKNKATSDLVAAGFVVVQNGGNGNWIVLSQIPQGGLVVPCGSTVTINQNP